ncbi:aminobenzoate oxygenase [Burkholderiaceae bacterium 16]|nr:aminobenzoate oxygenase [Burkholderiaceae bacterium 16]
MSSVHRYTLPVVQTGWSIGSQVATEFNWEYDNENSKLLQLYETSKKQQWNATDRIDWSQELDPENPQELDDRMIPIYGTPLWEKMGKHDRIEVRRHQQAHSLSQFLHGEQGALMVSARIVQMVPDMDAKFYAATQTMDEARHVEAYSRLLHEKVGILYPITPGLKSLLESILTDSRWDFCYLGMQVLVEGLALAAFQRIRDFSKNPLAASINAYVMQDEARHVAFGRTALRGFYPQVTEAERKEREDFVIEACYMMRDRFDQKEVWGRLGLPEEECAKAVRESETMRQFRQRLFSRIVPTVKDIGLWSPRVQSAFADMGAIEFANVDVEAQFAQDQKIAEEFDARRVVMASIGAVQSEAEH